MNIARIHSPAHGPEPVFISVINKEGAVLEPGKVVEWSAGTNATQPAGASVELVDAAVNLTSGIDGRVAGVVHRTIATGDVGVLQVYGYANVRSSASLAAGRMVVASSINATNIGHVDVASQSTAVGAEYTGAIVGWTVENSVNATNAKVFLTIH
jgi:hypothetical protein